MIPVVWLWLHDEPHEGFWDWEIVKDTLDRSRYELWSTEQEFDDEDWNTGDLHKVSVFDDVDGAVVVIPARQHSKSIELINEKLSSLKWCLVVLTGDEQSTFDHTKLKHPNMKLWVMHPVPGKHEGENIRYLPNGYPPQLKETLGKDRPPKDIDLYFSGQVNHPKRHEMWDRVRLLGGQLRDTEGFAQGLPPAEYYGELSRAKIALCPSGAHTPDTFRLYEALELGCVPLCDRKPNDTYPDGFWYHLFGEEPPFLFVNEWDEARGIIPRLLPHWQARANQCQAWWRIQKRKLAKNLEADLYLLTGAEPR